MRRSNNKRASFRASIITITLKRTSNVSSFCCDDDQLLVFTGQCVRFLCKNLFHPWMNEWMIHANKSQTSFADRDHCRTQFLIQQEIIFCHLRNLWHWPDLTQITIIPTVYCLVLLHVSPLLHLFTLTVVYLLPSLLLSCFFVGFYVYRRPFWCLKQKKMRSPCDWKTYVHSINIRFMRART